MERKLAAILAADVVGYGRLMEQDETSTLAALKARRKQVLEPLVARYHGRIFKVAGDGVLVEFASAVNAVECAVELQRGMAEANADVPEGCHIVLRIGINLGDVMMEGGDLYGDGVNIAARLEAIAERGSILVSGTTHDYVRNKVKARRVRLGVVNEHQEAIGKPSGTVPELARHSVEITSGIRARTDLLCSMPSQSNTTRRKGVLTAELGIGVRIQRKS